MAESPPLLVLGVDHHRTPLEVRERLAIGPEAVPVVAGRVRQAADAAEVVLLSTCNRLECYAVGVVDERRLAAALAEVAPDTWLPAAYVHRGVAAVRHLFRVASGLESLVVGEDQVLGQVRSAYEVGRASGSTGPVLNPLFQRALAIAKEVRSETGISRHRTSTATVAVDLARQVHGDLASARVLLIGAGEMAELTLRYLADQGVTAITIINRNAERAAALAATCGAQVRPWEDLADALAASEVAVTSTAAPTAIITPTLVRRRKAPLVLIDLAVPRDVDPAVADLDDVYVYNIDHLDGVIAAHRRLKAADIAAAEGLVEQAVGAHQAITPAATSLGVAIARFFDDPVQAEADRLCARLGLTDDTQRAEVRYALERLGGKLSHRLHTYAKAHPDTGEAVIRELTA